MPAEVQKKKKKADQLEVERRVQQVYEWMSEAKSRPTIMRLAAENWGSGTSERNLEEYMRRARKRILEDWSEVDRKEFVASALQTMQRVAELSIEQRQHSNAIGAVALQAKLLQICARDN